jgi:hypothetical protein
LSSIFSPTGQFGLLRKKGLGTDALCKITVKEKGNSLHIIKRLCLLLSFAFLAPLRVNLDSLRLNQLHIEDTLSQKEKDFLWRRSFVAEIRKAIDFWGRVSYF